MTLNFVTDQFCTAILLTGFYMRATLALNGLRLSILPPFPVVKDG